jgi:hypothetical protein
MYRQRRYKRNVTYPTLQNTPITSARQIFAGSIGTGANFDATWTNLLGSTASQSRISSADIELASETSAGNATVFIRDFMNNDVTSTRNVLYGSNPVRFKVRVPKSTDFGIPTGCFGAGPADRVVRKINLWRQESVVCVVAVELRELRINLLSYTVRLALLESSLSQRHAMTNEVTPYANRPISILSAKRSICSPGSTHQYAGGNGSGV